MAGLALLAALFPLDHLGSYIHWGWVYISDANAIVVALMIITFVVALFAPFPGRSRRKESR